jgi:hypothetical protein
MATTPLEVLQSPFVWAVTDSKVGSLYASGLSHHFLALGLFKVICHQAFHLTRDLFAYPSAFPQALASGRIRPTHVLVFLKNPDVASWLTTHCWEIGWVTSFQTVICLRVLERYFPPGCGRVPSSPSCIGCLPLPLTFVPSLKQPYYGWFNLTMVRAYLPCVLMTPFSTCTTLGW